jgi:hypothetical protein
MCYDDVTRCVAGNVETSVLCSLQSVINKLKTGKVEVYLEFVYVLFGNN